MNLKLFSLAALTPDQLTQALDNGGYTDCHVVNATFDKITANSGWHYKVTFYEHGEVVPGDIYVTISDEGKVIAEW